MATDIGFALGVLTLVSRSIPPALRLFHATLAGVAIGLIVPATPAHDAGGAVAVESLPGARKQDWARCPLAGGQVDGSSNARRQGDHGHLGSLAHDFDRAVAALGAEVLD